ncbi:lamin tail domain-containing protein, partial [bacterium]|nr:lamin tail domain-containing protein [bacterium]
MKFRITLLLFLLLCGSVLQGQSVIINEFCWQGSAPSGFTIVDEWIELKCLNPAGQDVTGWRLTIENDSGDPSTYKVIPLPSVTIPSGGFMLISNNNSVGADTAIASFGGNDIMTNETVIANDYFHVILGNNLNTTIDEVGDSGTLIYIDTDTSVQKSMERNIDHGNGTLKTSWHLCRKRDNINGTFDGTPGQENSARYGSIIINEIMWNGSPYIELCSQMVSSFDLSGWKIVGSTSGDIETFGSVNIDPGSYYLINNPTMLYTGEKLELRNITGITVDIVNQVGSWFSGNDHDGGMAMERNSSSADGEVEDSWHCAMAINSGRYGTPGTANSTAISLDIVVNEISWDDKEYIEIYNNKSYPISLHNWHIYNNSSTSAGNEILCNFTPDDVLTAGGYYVVRDAAVVVTCPEKNPALSLYSSGENIVIKDFEGNTIDSVLNYGIGWFAGTSSDNSMERNDPVFSGNVGYNWHTCRTTDGANAIDGTPGYINSIDGTGNATMSPFGPVDAGTEDTFTITFTSEALLTGGDVTVEIPPGWSVPTTTAANKGYVQVVAVTDVTHGTPIVNTTTVSSNTITINFTSFLPNQSIKIVYGSVNKAVVQRYSGSATFNISCRKAG